MLIAAVPVIQALIALAGEVPSLVEAGNTVVSLIVGQRDPTPDELAQFDKALDDAIAAIPKA